MSIFNYDNFGKSFLKFIISENFSDFNEVSQFQEPQYLTLFGKLSEIETRQNYSSLIY